MAASLTCKTHGISIAMTRLDDNDKDDNDDDENHWREEEEKKRNIERKKRKKIREKPFQSLQVQLADVPKYCG